MKRLILTLLAVLMVPAAAVAQGRYLIQPGDQLDISVLEDPTLNRQVLVSPDGRISVPIAGNIRAGGRSTSQVERTIQQRLASGFEVSPTVTVSLVALAPEKPREENFLEIYVIGEVQRPGLLRVERGTTLLQALSQVGGLSKFAATKRIQLRRLTKGGGEEIFVFNYRGIERGQRINTSLSVREGDVIVVPERRLFE